MREPSNDKERCRQANIKGWLGLLAVAGIAVGWFVYREPFGQDLSYHCFADQRKFFGIPHFLNVVSNVPFLVVGALGLWLLVGREAMHSGGPFRQPMERWPYIVFFLGVGLTSLGSSYYHWDPNNDRLLWDRLPMAIALMALLAGILTERVGFKIGLCLLPVLVAAGLASVLYWHWSEERGQGDLRPYYVVQYGAMLALAVLLLFFPPNYTGSGYLYACLACYVVAKAFEHPLDAPIFALGNLVSGHTLKHLAAALATLCVLRWLQTRKPIPL